MRASRVSCPKSTYCLAVGDVGAATPLVEQMIGSTSSEMSDSELPANTVLSDVSCPQVSNCYVDGYLDTEFSTAFIAHLVGNSWTISWQPLSGYYGTWGTYRIFVRALAPVRRWEYGWNKSTGDDDPIVATLSGGSWVMTTLPRQTGTADFYTRGVSCADSTDCVAVGDWLGTGQGSFAETLSNGVWNLIWNPLQILHTPHLLIFIARRGRLHCRRRG